MASSNKHPASVPELLESLRNLREEDPKAVRSTVHLYPASLYDHDASDAEGSTSAETRRITSWKMTEHMYFKANNKFPTLARGLFSEELDGDERIVARGYDKFFNTDEIAWTSVSILQYNPIAIHNGSLRLIHIVGRNEASHSGPISPYLEIQWLLDPDIGSIAQAPRGSLQALPRHHHGGSGRRASSLRDSW